MTMPTDKQKLQLRDAKISQQKHLIAEQREKIAELERALSKRDKALSQKEHQVTNLLDRLNESEGVRETLRQQEKALALRDAEIKRLTEKLADTERSITRAKKTRDSYEATILIRRLTKELELERAKTRGA